MADLRTITARWVFPVSGSPLANGTVTVQDGRIIAVEPHGTRTPDEDRGNVAIIPGLVNAHTHLDLSGARGLIPPTDPEHFTDWLRGVIAYRRSRTPEQVQADIRDGLAECLRFGTTLLGDITAGGASYHAVSSASVRAVLFWEVIGLTLERFTQAMLDFGRKTMGVDLKMTDGNVVTGSGWVADTYPATPRLRWTTSPHAPYSVFHGGASSSLFVGNTAIHFAESPAEMELIESKTGPFVVFLQQLGVWNAEAFTKKVHEFFDGDAASHFPRAPALYIHCNYLPPDMPRHPAHTVVYCPRTHAAFRHPPHPFRAFLYRGVRVCLGTDSLASNPDLDILADARFVHARYPDFPGEQLLRMVTLAGAEALGWADECGSLEVGKSADLVAVPLPDRDAPDPHELLFADHSGERRTMFRGEWRTDPEC